MSEPTKAVFLSYASQDAEAARRICEALRAAGIEVWFDQSELRGGDAWDAAIRKQIKSCGLFIPVISQNTHARGEGYFRLEWKLAVDRSHLISSDLPFLLPVAIDDTRDDDERTPERFRELQWTRLPGGETPPAFVERVARLLAPGPNKATGPSPAQTPAFATSGLGTALTTPDKGSRFVPLVIAAIALLGGGYVALDKFVLSKRSVATVPAASAPSAISEQSIAVLPFLDLSEQHDQEYFAAGMADEVTALLAKIPQLKVISRSSARQFRGRDVDVKTIGSTLGVRYVVEGSVARSADRIRITAELVDTRDGSQRWSETYDRSIGETFAVQDAIAASLVRALELSVGSAGLEVRSMPKNPAVYDLYLRGLQSSDRYDREGLEQAQALFQQALELDAGFAPAAIGLAQVLNLRTEWGYVAPQVGFEQSRKAAELASRLDPLAAAPHQIISTIHTQYDWDWSAALSEADRAIALDSGYAYGYVGRSIVLMALGRLQEAASALNHAISLDPLSPGAFFNRGWVNFWAGHLPEAEASFRRALQISPTYESAHFYLGHVLLARGDAASALAQMQLEPDPESKLAGIAAVQFAMGHIKDSDAALAQLTQMAANDWASGIAMVHAMRNEPDAAFAWLDRAYAQRDEDLYIINGNPLLRNVMHDARYGAFLRKMNLPE
jgi:TolB-like protein/tetratricopeptide (TPR) repeat protein